MVNEKPLLPDDVEHILRDLNPWWTTGQLRHPPPRYRRRQTSALLERLSRKKGLIEIIRGPRQVGKTTALEQAIDHLLTTGARPRDVMLVRFDQEVLRASRGGLLPVVRWYEAAIRKRPLGRGRPSFLFLDEVHKLDDWHSDVKHVWDTFRVRLVLTGSSSVLVARGSRESLAGRTVSSEFPTFPFREVIEAWAPKAASWLPDRTAFEDLIGADPRDTFEPLRMLHPQRRHSLNRHLERYYNRGGYPRLYNGEVDEDSWADYLTETIFDRVLGVDVPDLFPVRNPKLLRWLYIEVARRTGQEVPQKKLAEWANVAGYSTNQPVIGTYLHYLNDALLVREFRRYPLARRESTRTPAKICLTDLGPRNAVFRGAPSLWESPEDVVGPLAETLVQSVIRGANVQVHFYRDHEKPGERRTPVREVDFVAEHTSGETLPIEVKFRRSIKREHDRGLASFMKRFDRPYGLLVTRDTYEWDQEHGILAVPLLQFLLAF